MREIRAGESGEREGESDVILLWDVRTRVQIREEGRTSGVDRLTPSRLRLGRLGRRHC